VVVLDVYQVARDVYSINWRKKNMRKRTLGQSEVGVVGI